MKCILSFIFYFAFSVTATAQRSYAEAIQQGDDAFARQAYKIALDKYFAAEAFDPTRKDSVKAKVNRLFERVEKLRLEELAARQRATSALRAKSTSDSLRIIAEYAKRKTQLDKDELTKKLEIIKGTNKALAQKLFGLSTSNTDLATKQILIEVQDILEGKMNLSDTTMIAVEHFTITVEHLKAIAGRYTKHMPGLVEWMNKICPTYGIKTARQFAHFIAQACYETANFALLRELGDGAIYEGRRELGNDSTGDGARYIGRGLIFTTGRSRYLQLGIILKGDRNFFLNNPELLETPEYAVRAACEFWNSRGLVRVADLPDDTQTLKISPIGGDIVIGSPLEFISRSIVGGGPYKLADRKKYYDLAKQVLK